MAGGAADGLYTYDLELADGGPRVPDVDDLGGVNIQNGSPAPQKGRDRDADMDNVQTATLTGLCRMGPTCRLWIEFPLGTATIVAIDSMGTAIVPGDFTLNPNATGDLNIEWAAGLLPPQNRKPHAWLTDDPGFAYGTFGTNFVEIFSFDYTGAPADLSFAVDIFG